jgi:hypothetical protein
MKKVLLFAILLAGATAAVKAQVSDESVRSTGATSDGQGVPTETGLWENITRLGSDSPQEVILDKIMGLNVVEYNMKMNMPSEEDLIYLNVKDKEAYLKRLAEREAAKNADRHIGLLANELKSSFPDMALVKDLQDGKTGINYIELVPVLISCIQELKTQLDIRTEKMVDIMMSRGADASTVSAARAAFGNSLLSIAPTPVGESAEVRFLLDQGVSNAYLSVVDMGGRVVTRLPVSPTDMSASIDSSILGEGIYLCTLYADGQNIGTRRLVKTK